MVATALSRSSLGKGLSLGLSYRNRGYGFIVQGRSMGGLYGEDDVSFLSLDAGPRFFVFDKDHIAFLGAGVGIGGLSGWNIHGSGIFVYTEVGVEFIRTERFGLGSSVRVDLPTYKAEKSSPFHPTTTESIVPLSLNVVIQLH